MVKNGQNIQVTSNSILTHCLNWCTFLCEYCLAPEIIPISYHYHGFIVLFLTSYEIVCPCKIVATNSINMHTDSTCKLKMPVEWNRIFFFFVWEGEDGFLSNYTGFDSYFQFNSSFLLMNLQLFSWPSNFFSLRAMKSLRSISQHFCVRFWMGSI